MGQKTADWTELAGPAHASQPADELERRAPRGRRRKWAGAGTAAAIPIVNDAHQIVGWTQAAPVVENGRLRHAAAERVLRSPIFCTQIALFRAQDIRRAGGPSDWTGPWRCLALCPIENARGTEQLGIPRFGASERRAPAEPSPAVGLAPARFRAPRTRLGRSP